MANSINNELALYTGTENWYKVYSSYVCTDGVKALAELGECFWLINDIAIIADFARRKYTEIDLDMMVFTLQRVEKTDRFVLKISDGNKVFETKDIPFSDFKYDEAVVWVEQNVMLLPSEH